MEPASSATSSRPRLSESPGEDVLACPSTGVRRPRHFTVVVRADVLVTVV